MSHMAEQTNEGWGFLTGMMVGAAIGATAALLFAPKRGRELRGDIVDAANEFGEGVSTTMNDLGKAAGDLVDRGRSAATEASRAVREGAQNVADSSSALYESGRAAVARVASAADGKDAHARKDH